MRTRTAETVEFVLSEKRPADRAGHPQIGEARRVLHDAGRPDILRARGEGLKPTLKGRGGCEMSSFRTRCSAD